MRVGVISDTHGLLRPEAVAALRGCEHILHAGDIGKPEILQALGALAPVTAVRGNNDRGAWAAGIPDVQVLSLGGVTLHLLHDLQELAKYPPPAPPQVLVAGHSHRPSVARRDGLLVLNPGSAGPRRFKLPVTVAELLLDGGRAEARIVPLLDG